MLLHKELINPQIRLSDMAEMKLGGNPTRGKIPVLEGDTSVLPLPYVPAPKITQMERGAPLGPPMLLG